MTAALKYAEQHGLVNDALGRVEKVIEARLHVAKNPPPAGIVAQLPLRGV